MPDNSDRELVLAPDTELAALAHRVRVEIRAAQGSLCNALRSAMNAGEALIEARPKVEALGVRWRLWLAESCRVAPRTALLYMQLARHRDQIEAALRDDPNLSLRAARKLISRPRPSNKSSKADAAAESLVDHWRRSPDELGALLDAAGVDGMLAAMSPTFGSALRAKIPAPERDPSPPKIKKPSARPRRTFEMVRAGTDEQGAPLYAKTERRVFRH